jgi:hypothetical protein
MYDILMAFSVVQTRGAKILTAGSPGKREIHRSFQKCEFPVWNLRHIIPLARRI